MRNSRRIAGRSAWSALAASVTVATLAASLAGCGTDTEPQAIVMKQKGKSLPEKTGPEPSMNCVIAGSWPSGQLR